MKTKTITDKVKELSGLIKNTDIEKIAVKKDGLKVGVKKMPAEEGNTKDISAKKNKRAKKKDEEAPLKEIFSHSVGHFRDYALPSRKAFVRKGQYVEKGQKLGMIESMKIMKELLSPCEGKVVGKFVKHGDAVEYGQKLFEIKIV